MSRKCKAIFTMEETVQLTGLFDAGLDSVSKEKADAIRDVARKLNKTEQEIKVYNYMCVTIIKIWSHVCNYNYMCVTITITTCVGILSP